jgi:WD40 repeat protein
VTGDAVEFTYAGPEPVPPVVPPKPKLAIIEGDGQFGVAGRCVEGELEASPHLPDVFRAGPGKPLVVDVRDENDGEAVMPGVPLLFAPEEVDAFVVEAPGYSTVTNAAGRAGVRYVLGAKEGLQKVKVSILGDAATAPVEFTETAEAPVLEVSSWGTLVDEVLAGSGELSTTAVLRRVHLGSAVAIPHSALALDVRVGGVVASDGKEMYLSPLSGQTDEDGVVVWSVVPLAAGRWSVTVKGVEFAGLEKLAVDKPVVERVRRMVDAPEASTPSIVVRSLKGGESENGKVATKEHPIRVALWPDRLLGAHPGLVEPLVKGWKVFLHDTCAEDPCTLIRVAGSAGGEPALVTEVPLGTGLVVELVPTGAHPSPRAVGLDVARVGPDGAVSGEVHSELLSYGAPEVRIVERRSDGSLESSSEVLPWNPLAEAPAGAYILEARLPLSEPGETTGGCRGLDIDRRPLEEVPGRMAGLVVDDLVFTRIGESARYATYRSDPTRPVTVLTARTLPEASVPTLPSGSQYVQAGKHGHLGVFVRAEERITVTVPAAEPDLQVDGLTDRYDDNPGLALLWNDDDDNADGRVDLADGSSVAGENDLLHAGIVTTANRGEILVEVENRGTGRVRLWTTPDRRPGTEFPTLPPLAIRSAGRQADLWIEGVVGSTAPWDVRIMVTRYAVSVGASLSASREVVPVTVIPLRVIRSRSQEYHGVGWKPDGSYAVIVGSGGRARKYVESDYPSLTDLATGVVDRLESVAWKPDGSHALVVGGDWGARPRVGPWVGAPRSVALTFDGVSWAQVYRGNLDPVYEKFWRCAWKPGAEYALVTGEAGPFSESRLSGDGILFRWDGSALTPLAVPSVDGRRVSDLIGLSWKPDGSVAIIGGDDDQYLYQWDEVGGFKGIDRPTHPAASALIAWSPDGSCCLVRDNPGVAELGKLRSDGRIETLRWTREEEERRLRNEPAIGRFSILGFRAAAWHPTGSYAIVVGPTGRIVLYDSSINRLTMVYHAQSGHADVVYWDAAWKPGGGYALCAQGER